jgi:hypothetical protein
MNSRGGTRTTIWRCSSSGWSEKTFDNLFAGNNEPSSTKLSLLRFSARFPLTGMETFQRTRVLASTCWNAWSFSSLMAFLRASTVLLFAISMGKMLLVSSSSTKQLRLSCGCDSESGFGWVTAKAVKSHNNRKQTSRWHLRDDMKVLIFRLVQKYSRQSFHGQQRTLVNKVEFAKVLVKASVDGDGNFPEKECVCGNVIKCRSFFVLDRFSEGADSFYFPNLY